MSAHGAGASIVVLVPNSVTAPLYRFQRELERTALQDALFVLDEGPGGALARAARALGRNVVEPLNLPAVPEAQGRQLENYELCWRAGRDDRVIQRLPIAGHDRPGATDALWQDRLVWCTAAEDPKTFVERLPIERAPQIVVIGGASERSMLPELIVARARQCGRHVVAQIFGPTRGGYAPLWALGADEALVDGPSEARALQDLAPDLTVSMRRPVAPKLAPWLDPDAGPRPLLLDVGHGTERSAVYSALRRFALAHAMDFPLLFLAGHPVTTEIYRHHLGARIGPVELQVLPGDPLAIARERKIALLSAAPWRAVHHVEYLAGIELGVLAAPWQIEAESLPDWILARSAVSAEEVFA